MKFNSIKYLFFEGLKNLLNNVFMAIASIGVLTACLLIVGFSVLLKINMKNIISFMGQQSTIVIFLKDEAKPELVEELKNVFKNNENVKEVEYVSKEQAIQIFNKKYNNEIMSKTVLENNILPASLNVHIKNVEKSEDIISSAKNEKYLQIIEFIKAPTKYMSAIKEINKTTRIFSTVLIFALIIASLFIISNTIRATVFARRREIAIMKQVGATNSFVRFPFLVEGSAIGLISAIIAFILTAVLYKTINLMITKYSSDFLNSMFSTLVSFKSVSFLMAISFLVCGTLTGAIGSIISLMRYLKI